MNTAPRIDAETFGARRASAHRRRRRGLPGWLLVALVLFIIPGLLGLMFTALGGGLEQPQRIGAYDAAQRAVSRELLSPASAVYPDRSKVSITKRANARCRVAGYVDAQNGFGAMIRIRWVAVVFLSTDDEWMLETLSVGE